MSSDDPRLPSGPNAGDRSSTDEQGEWPARSESADRVSADQELANPTENEFPEFSPNRFVIWGVLVEGLMVVIALLSASLTGFFDHDNPLTSIFAGNWIVPLAAGTFSAGLLLVLILGLEKSSLPGIKRLMKVIHEKVVPLFRSMSIWQIAVISISAGIGEEFLFRWCLQGGLVPYLGPLVSLLVASVIFGLLHWVCFEYAVMATLIGLLIGLLYFWQGPLAAIACHALFDFVAIIDLQRSRQ